MLRTMAKSRAWPALAVALGCLPLMGLECDQGTQLRPHVAIAFYMTPAEPGIEAPITIDANATYVRDQSVRRFTYRIDDAGSDGTSGPVFWREDAVDFPGDPAPQVVTSLRGGHYELTVTAHWRDQFGQAMADSASHAFWVSACGPAPYVDAAPPDTVRVDADGVAAGLPHILLPDAVDGLPYTAEIAVSGGVDPLVFRQADVVEDEWPAWLTLSGDGRLDAARFERNDKGYYVLRVTVADGCFNGAREVDILLDLDVLDAECGPGPVIAGLSRPVLNSGWWYEELQIDVEGGRPPYRLLGPPLTALPEPLGLESYFDTLRGVAGPAGEYTFPVAIRDDCRRTVQDMITVTVVEPACEQMLRTSGHQRAFDVGTPLEHELVVGGQPPYSTTRLSGALPPGLTLDAAAATVGGTPTATGTFEAEYEVSDSCPDGTQTVTVWFRCEITEAAPGCPPLFITNEALPWGAVGMPYAAAITTSGGMPPMHFQELSALPAGLTLDYDTGQLSGTPTAGGPVSLTVLVYDSCTPEVQQVTRTFEFGFE